MDSLLNSSVTMTQLIKLSEEVEVQDNRIHLSSAIINTQLANTRSPNYTATDAQESYRNEVIDFVIIRKPYVSIDTGALMQYNMTLNLKGNVVYSPKITSALAFNLQQEIKPQYSTEYTPISMEYNRKNTFTWRGIKDAIKKHLPIIRSASAMIHPILGGAVDLASGLLDSDAPEQ